MAHTAQTFLAQRIVIGRNACALITASVSAATALIAPPLALLVLALLAAHALMRAPHAPRLDLLALAGPAFAAFIAGAFAGLPVAIGVLFVWRVFADTRWSIGEAQRLALAAGRPGEATLKALLHAWLTPLAGVAVVAYTAPHMVAGLPLDLPHLPAWSVIGVCALAGLAVFDWAVRRAADWRLGELAPAPLAHLAAHHVMFVLAYAVTLDVSAGLVGMIAWRLAHAAPLAFTLKRGEAA